MAMENYWIYKADGTIQCLEEPIAISLEEMAKELITALGNDCIVQQRKLHIPTVKMCRVPTGALNAYELTPAAFEMWEKGISGKMDFEQLNPALIPRNQEDDYSRSAASDMAKSQPDRIDDLPGHLLRTYKTGDPITMDYRPSRFNVETSHLDIGVIVKVWFG
jgi:hypothetical protein